jgi:hypothetical protein
MATSTYSGTPEFTSTSIESPVCKFALQLVTERENVLHSMGTAVLFGPGIALTAGHIIDACERAYGWSGPDSGDFLMHAFQYGEPESAKNFTVAKIWRANFTDLAVLQLRGGADWLPPAYPRLTLIPPSRGDKVFAFGHPGSVESIGKAVQITANGHTTTGEVLEVYAQGRDKVLAPFPCFRTSARFDDAMSGSPVFDEQGILCGIVCSNMPPELPDGEHSSIVTLLWPLAGLEIDIPWPDYPAWPKYTLYEFFRARGEAVIGAERLLVEDHHVGFRTGGADSSGLS